MTFWDLVSLCILVILALPVLLIVFDGDPTRRLQYLVVLIGILVCEIIIKITRIVLPKQGVFLRPSNAVNCSLYNRGGNYAGRVGMPSGHVALTTFVLCSILYIYKSNANHSPIVYVLVVLMIGLMCMSRYYRHCHNIPQIVMGFVLGILLTWIFVQFDKKRKSL